MNKIELTYRIECTDSTMKISPINGLMTHGVKIDKEGKEVIVEPKSLAQAVNFLLSLLRTIDISQFKGKIALRINGIKVSEKMLKCKVYEWDMFFPKEAAVICATLAAMDQSLTQQWGKECNLHGNQNAVFDAEDISALSVELVKKATFLTNLRKRDAVQRVWSDKELKLLETYKDIRKKEAAAKKALTNKKAKKSLKA